MKKLFVVLTLALLPATVMAQDLSGVKCIINPKADVKDSTGVEFNGGTVYFCCGNCAGKFSDKPDNFAAPANYQMVTSGQFKQTACPLTGRPVNNDLSAQVGQVKVGLCCNGCKKKMDEATDLAARTAIAFGTDAFGQGFAPAGDEIDLTGITCMMMPDQEVDPDSFAMHHGGKVFFCCGMCVKGFNKDPEKHAAQANRQLVETGQFVQTGCPFSGRPVASDKMVKIGEMEVGFCCGGCQSKVADAGDDTARTGMVFGPDAFGKGFAAKDSK